MGAEHGARARETQKPPRASFDDLTKFHTDASIDYLRALTVNAGEDVYDEGPRCVCRAVGVPM